MPILKNIDSSIDVDQVIRAQGADPVIIRERRKNLVDIAQQALEIGTPLLEPRVLFQEKSVHSVLHQKIKFANKQFLQGELISKHLASAQKIVILICTIGNELETESYKQIKTTPPLGLALEGVGSAAVEALANAACNYFEKKYQHQTLQSTIPLSPGMQGWPVEIGQPQIFNILDPSQIGIQLTKSHLMIPRKSLSMVIGLSTEITEKGTTCDYCSMKETCRYQDHYH